MVNQSGPQKVDDWVIPLSLWNIDIKGNWTKEKLASEMPKPYLRFSNLPSNVRKGKAEVKSTEPQTSKNGTGKEKKLKPVESLKPADGGETATLNVLSEKLSISPKEAASKATKPPFQPMAVRRKVEKNGDEADSTSVRLECFGCAKEVMGRQK